jgi:hypothetical protein
VFVIDPDDVVGLELDSAVFDAFTAIITTVTITTPISSREKAFHRMVFLCVRSGKTLG